MPDGPRSALRTPRSAPVAGERAAPPSRHVLHAETRPRFVEPDRIVRPAVPVEHSPVLLVRRIEDRFQKVHEAVRPADILRRTAPSPVHNGRILNARIVQAIVRGLPTYKGLACDVGIVTPYGAQAQHIEALLANALDPGDLASLKIATAHRFQGDERDIMYFSPVIDRSMTARDVRFAANPNLINVALTRARRRLIIVGDPDACLAHDNALRDLATYALRLDAAGFDSPLELGLHEALLKRGIAARTGVVVGHHRLDLAIEQDGMRLDIECDGAAFHTDYEKDAARDLAIQSEGWTVMRFSGRALSRDLDACVDAIAGRLASD